MELTSKNFKTGCDPSLNFGWDPIFVAVLLRHSGSRNGYWLDRSAISALSVTPLTQSLKVSPGDLVDGMWGDLVGHVKR